MKWRSSRYRLKRREQNGASDVHNCAQHEVRQHNIRHQVAGVEFRFGDQQSAERRVKLNAPCALCASVRRFGPVKGPLR
jgi:hypothetical protein